jgi:hypothetical protein
MEQRVPEADVRRVSFLTAGVLIAAVAVTSACGQQRANSPSALGASPSAASAGGAGACLRPKAGAPGHMVTVGISDNGKSLCVKPGTALMVLLRGTPDRTWASIHASSRVLEPRGNGILTLQRGVTGAYFVAAHTGSAVISAVRPACARASMGDASCGARLTFHTTVVVGG